jgi:hypothetical protein
LPYKVLLKFTDRQRCEAAQRQGPEAIMRTWLQRIRGAIGIGVTWAAAWFAAGVVPRWVFGINTDAPLPLVFGLFGLIAGLVFSAVLMMTERRRSFEQMSLPRFAGWGAMGGLLLSAFVAMAGSLGWGDALVLAPTLAIASAVCATGSLAIAKRAARRELPGTGGTTAEAELRDHEKPELPEGGS